MKLKNELVDFILKEWLLIASGSGFALTSFYTKQIPCYSIQEMQVLLILFSLFIAIKGLEESGLILMFSQSIEKGKAVPLKLMMATFFLSMLVTNDVAIIVIVPLTLGLNINRKSILVILEALAANAGSALTPFGNPQNLFIYWFYDISPAQFILSIAPFSLIFLALLVISSLFVHTHNNKKYLAKAQEVRVFSFINGLLLVVVFLTVLRVLPVSAVLFVVLYALLFDRKSLNVDYALLLSFFFFFGLAENMKSLLAPEIRHSGHVFLFSAIASQIMSNVPATLLFAKFTTHWKALLWGANVGGFGSLFGSMANLIAYKFYVTHENTNNTAFFTLSFLVAGYVAFFLGIGLYFILGKIP